jgi:hypothetical protein
MEIRCTWPASAPSLRWNSENTWLSSGQMEPQLVKMKSSTTGLPSFISSASTTLLPSSRTRVTVGTV